MYGFSPADFYIRFHFIQFLKLYHNPQRDHQALFLCRQHMSVLLVLAANRSPHIRHRFHQLSGEGRPGAWLPNCEHQQEPSMASLDGTLRHSPHSSPHPPPPCKLNPTAAFFLS